MSLMTRMRIIDDFFHIEADPDTLEWLSGKTDEELSDMIERLQKEKEVAIRLQKDLTMYHNNIKTAMLLIEYRALKKLSNKVMASVIGDEEVEEEIGGISLT